MISDFTFNVLAPTRDKCTSEMDEISLGIMQVIGGSPWLTVVDEVKRRPITDDVQSDEGFAYHGSRRVVFQGLATLRPDMPPPPGASAQRSEEDVHDH